ERWYIDAGCAGSQNRVDTVEALPRRAAGTRLALVARRAGVVEVVAARALQQVAARTGHVAQLWRGAGQDGLGQQRVTLFYQRVPGQIGVAYQRSDHQAAA